MKEFFFNLLVTRRHYVLLGLLVIMLFVIYYYIVSPSNFGSFSTTLRYYLSALGTLLAVVVSFNTLAVQNQLKNMPDDIKTMNSQLNNIQSLLEPVMKRRQKDGKNGLEVENNGDKKYKESKSNTFENAPIYSSDALESMIIVVKEKAKSYLDSDALSKEVGEDGEFKNICKKIHQECVSRLSA